MTRRRITSASCHALAGLLALVCSAGAVGAEIYRCQKNGVTTFVDSPNRCPNGDAQRQAGDGQANSAAPQRSSVARGTEVMERGQPVSDARRTPAPATLVCGEVAQDATRFRQCLREKRRVEVRQIASSRLAAVSRAVSDYVAWAAKTGSVLATSKKGRAAQWCEDVLRDVIESKNIEVVDDEEGGGPRFWSNEILDPEFTEWNHAGAKVPHGYVTVRWRVTNLVVLGVAAACVDTGDGKANCVAQRHTSIRVHDGTPPVACNVSAVGKQYWPNWKHSQTPIFAEGVHGPGAEWRSRRP